MSKELLKNLRSGEPVSPEQLAKILESGGIDMATGAKVVTFQKALARIGVSPQDLAAAVQLQKALKAQGNSPQAIIQVWPLTLFPFCKESLICLDGNSMTPCQGKTIFFRFSQQLPRLQPLKGFFTCQGALQGLSTCLVCCVLNYRETRTARCAALGAEVPGHRQRQLTQTLILLLLKTHFIPTILDFVKSTE